ncbi:MAG: hypothetical protein AB1610_07010 [Nitrospirota bacterium]
MEKIKSAFEKAMEKAEGIGKLTSEEKEKIRDQETIKSLLSDFYKGKLDRDGLWHKLKGSSPLLLKEAQQLLVASLRMGNTHEEFQQRKDGILAIETLKDKKRTQVIEQILNSIERLQKEYHTGKKRAVDELKAEIERNPQMRFQPVRSPDGKTVFQASLSVDEAVQTRLSDYLSEHEKVYTVEFFRMIERLKMEIL